MCENTKTVLVACGGPTLCSSLISYPSIGAYLHHRVICFLPM